ncbi:DegT/DnrJ/EryC1/StrS family aminotransferase [Chloroflexota bacterium]
MKIRLVKPYVGKEELENIKEVLERAWLGNGPKVVELEKAWSEYLGCRDSVAVNSCTAALHLALWVYQFPKGKKVLVPAMTFVSTANAALYNGLTPVFVDVDEATLGIDLADLERKCDQDCVAAMPVHFGGHPVPMDELMPWAKSHNLKVISDCAHCAGGQYKGRKLGTWADIGCFSFEEKKCLATGDGGMVSSDDEDLIEKIRGNRQVGMSSGTWQRFKQAGDNRDADAYHWYYDVRELGYKYNMNDVIAAIGLAQLKKLDYMNNRRVEILKKYLDGIKDCHNVKPAFPYDLTTTYYDFMVRTRNRDEFIIHMQKKGVATGVHTMPVPLLSLYQDYEVDIPTAMRIWEEYVVLPLYVELSDEKIAYVIECIREFDRRE